MSKSIRIQRRLLEELRHWFELQGGATTWHSDSAMVSRAISLLVYGRENLADARADAAEILAETAGVDSSPTIKGSVARFVQTYNWPSKPDDSILGADLRKQLAEARRNKASECQISFDHTTNTAESQQQEPIEPTFDPTVPPWSACKRISIATIVSGCPKHPLLDWAGDNRLRMITLEVAFAAVPVACWYSSAIKELVLKLYKDFSEWEAQKEAEDEKT